MVYISKQFVVWDIDCVKSSVKILYATAKKDVKLDGFTSFLHFYDCISMYGFTTDINSSLRSPHHSSIDAFFINAPCGL